MKKLKLILFALLSMIIMPAFAQTTVNGLVVVVRYNDYKINATNAQINAMLNQDTGFNLWGNTTSVKQYFKVQSDNKFILNSTIIDVQLTQNSSYYHAPNLPYDGGQLLVKDVVAAVNAKYPSGFTGLTLHPTEDRLWHFSIISQSAPTEGAGVNYGLVETHYVLNNGQSMPIRGVALISYTQTNTYDVNVICHEYGHGVMAWTDYYRTAFCNLGDYDVMASAGTSKAPMPINPGLRLQKGWIGNVVNISGTTTSTYTVTANSYSQIHKYTNPNNPKEYLLINALAHGGYYQPVMDNGKTMDQGLAIWYVDEESKFDVPGVDNQYFIRLLQADNVDEMHDEFTANSADVRGDLDDLYDNVSNTFPNGTPFRWKDGGEFGISISNISAPGATMSFTVNARPNSVIATSDGNGDIFPKGTLSVVSGQSKSFNFTPNPGYEIDAIKVNGAPVTIANPYTLSSVSGTTNVQVTFRKKASIDPLPTPWLKADIGFNSNAGFVAQVSGKFNVETYGSYMGGASDNLTFLYQPLNGNGTIIAKIAGSNKVSWNERVGVMIRESLQENAVQSMICKVPHSGISIQQRTATGASLYENPMSIGSLHRYELFNWFKLVRSGNDIMSYCSKDGVNWIIVAQQSIAMNTQVYVGLFVTGANGANVSRAIFENVSVSGVAVNGCSFANSKITGTVIGTLGSWNNSGNTREKAFDGNIFSYFDANVDIAWTGLSLNNPSKVTGIRYFPREGTAFRMVGGKFQGSNSPDFSSGVVDLATITAEPAYDWNCITITNTTSFQYLRYICAAGGVGNVAEIEFYGTVGNVAPSVNITSPSNNATYSTPVNLGLAANATDADGTVTKVEFYINNSATPLGTDLTAPYTFTWSNVAAGTYSITAKATDNAGAVTTSAPVAITVISSVNQTPYGGTAWLIPGTIEAENYDLGGQGVAFNDVTTANQGGAFRTDAVDMEVASGGGYNVGYIVTDEWLEYTVNVSAGTYSIDARVAATAAGKNFRLELDGVSIASFTFPNTGGWQTWQTTSATGVVLTAGQKVLRIYATSTDFNIDKVIFTKTNIAPTVTITSPVSNATFTAPASITVSANASDADGSVSKVDFYYGTQLIGTDNTSPYAVTWSNVTAGSYNLTAIATDNLLATKTSTAVTITVNAVNNQKPTVTITSPVSNASFTAPAGITINVNAADADGSVSKVDFYYGTQLIGTDNTSPYSVTWNNVVAGSYNLTAIATDNLLATTTSVAVNVTVNPATNGCAGTSAYIENGGYVAGSMVQNAGAKYQCKPWPYSGWCNGAAFAYAPGTGNSWGDAWVLIGSCSARMGNASNNADVAKMITVAPNPTDNNFALGFEALEFNNADLSIIDSYGKEVMYVKGYNSGNSISISSLPEGMYLIRISNGDQTFTQKIVKN